MSSTPNFTPTPGSSPYQAGLAEALGTLNAACLQNPPNGASNCIGANPAIPFPAATPLPSVVNACTQANAASQAVALAGANAIQSFLAPNGAATQATQDAAASLNVGSCQNYQSSGSSNFLHIAPDNTNVQGSCGCSQVALNVEMSQSIENNLNCSCTNVSAAASVISSQTNTIIVSLGNVSAGGNINVMGGGGQTTTMTGTIINYLDVNVQTQLKNSILNALSNLNSALLGQNNTETPPNAQKTLGTTMAAAMNNAANLDMNSIISQAGFSSTEANTYTLIVNNITAGGNINIETPTQADVASIMAKQITQAVMRSIITNEMKTQIVNQNNDNITQANKGGVPTVGGIGGIAGIVVGIIIIIILIVVFFKVVLPMLQKGTSGGAGLTTGIVIGIIVVIVVMALFFRP
jgi:hypothetical protein